MAQIEQYNVVTQQSQSSTNNNNNNAINSTSSSKTMTRGREVIVVFSMQGMGILANSLILTFLLMLTKSKGQQQNDYDDDNNQQQQQGDDDYNNNSYSNQYHNQITLLYIWRIIYAIGLAILIYVLVSRIRHLNESEVWTQDRLRRDEEELERQHQRQQKQGGRLEEGDGDAAGFVPPSIVPQDVKVKEENKRQQQLQQHEHQQQSESQLLFKHYGIRLFGTSITWLLWDIGK